MKTSAIVLPGLALGMAALMLRPGSEAAGFVLNGESLGNSQRDVRLFDNFADAQSNNNIEPSAMYPGYVGAEMAIWKGIAEWGSLPHGTGAGDPTQTSIGDGGAYFDGVWMGNADSTGGTNNNIASAIGSCGVGILAFAESPYSDGWRIRFCDDAWSWADGPASIGGRQDIQGIMAHEYGHALGLDHSGDNTATMFFSTAGGTGERSIAADDIAGLQAIYGVLDSDKPVICEVSVSGTTMTIKGANFDALDNDVWFTPSAVTASGSDPRVRVFNVPSSNASNSELTFTIPGGAGPGDVLVRRTNVGSNTLSNAFPTDLSTTISVACPLSLAAMVPSTIESLDPGTAQTVTLHGTDFNAVTDLFLNGATLISTSRWTAVDDNTITLDMPQGFTLGSGNTIGVSDGADTITFPFTVVEAASPKLELGDGDPTFTVANGGTMNVIVAGTVGTVHSIYYSNSNLPSSFPKGTFLIGNNFTHFPFAALFAIGPDGYTEFVAPINFGGGSPMTFYSQSIDFTTPPSPNFGISNLQTITLTP